MERSALKEKADGSNDSLETKSYEKQKCYLVNLSRKTKKDYMQKHTPHGSSSKNSWKFCKPLFTNKSTNFDNEIILVEKKKLVSKNE